MRFRDWLFAHVYLPHKKKWARTRSEEIVKRRDLAYWRLMQELRRLEDDLHEMQEEQKK